MGWPVVTVASGGIPVTDNSALGYGVPVEEAANGFGTPVTYVAGGGLAVLGGVSSPVAWRGLGQAMTSAVQGLQVSANWSQTTRSRHYSNGRFRRFRVVLQTFSPTGTGDADTDFANSYNFQVGFEYPYTNANTGIAARVPVTFSGANTASYVAGVGPFGYILSDIIDLGYWVPANAFFGLWTTVENALAGGSPANTLPYQRNLSNFNERYVGQVIAAASQISAATALTATSITHSAATQTGSGAGFSPCMMLIETDASLPCVAIMGDSLGYGVAEGNTGSLTNGDCMGSALGNAGYLARGVFEVANVNGINLAMGSDANRFLATALNWQYRRQLLVLANPTHVVNQNFNNDCSQSTDPPLSWAATTAFSKWDVVNDGTGTAAYIATQGGTTATVRPSGTGSAIVDGTVVWSWVCPWDTQPRKAARSFGFMCNVNDQIKTAVPNARRLQVCGTPNATTTDSYATAINQPAAPGWGDGTSRRGLLNVFIRALDVRLQINGYIDPNAYVEDSFPTETSKFVVSGAANYAIANGDNPHLNSKGYSLAQAAVTRLGLG